MQIQLVIFSYFHFCRIENFLSIRERPFLGLFDLPFQCVFPPSIPSTKHPLFTSLIPTNTPIFGFIVHFVLLRLPHLHLLHFDSHVLRSPRSLLPLIRLSHTHMPHQRIHIVVHQRNIPRNASLRLRIPVQRDDFLARLASDRPNLRAVVRSLPFQHLLLLSRRCRRRCRLQLLAEVDAVGFYASAKPPNRTMEAKEGVQRVRLVAVVFEALQ